MQEKSEQREEMLFMLKQKTIIAAFWIEALRTIKITLPETNEIIYIIVIAVALQIPNSFALEKRPNE